MAIYVKKREKEMGERDRRGDWFGSLEQEIGHRGIMTDTGINAHPAKPVLLIGPKQQVLLVYLLLTTNYKGPQVHSANQQPELT